jgi:hypothetical protein
MPRTHTGVRVLVFGPGESLGVLSSSEGGTWPATGILRVPAEGGLRLSASWSTGEQVSRLAGLAPEALYELDLLWAKIDDEHLPVIAKLTGLESLSLQDTAVTDHGLPALAPLHRLESLDLDRTATSDVGVGMLRVLANLRSIALGGKAITDRAVTHLADLPRLRNISLVGTSVSDRSVAVLAAMPALERVVILGSKLTPSGAKALRAARPGLIVLTVGTYRSANFFVFQVSRRASQATRAENDAGAGATSARSLAVLLLRREEAISPQVAEKVWRALRLAEHGVTSARRGRERAEEAYDRARLRADGWDPDEPADAAFSREHHAAWAGMQLAMRGAKEAERARLSVAQILHEQREGR